VPNIIKVCSVVCVQKIYTPLFFPQTLFIKLSDQRKSPVHRSSVSHLLLMRRLLAFKFSAWTKGCRWFC